MHIHLNTIMILAMKPALPFDPPVIIDIPTTTTTDCGNDDDGLTA